MRWASSHGVGEVARATVLHVMSYEDLLFGAGTTEVAMEPPGTPHEPRLYVGFLQAVQRNSGINRS
eukprot:COSAG02_NODE_1538_length_12042_cov_323.842083_10_plen_66_part_00